MMKVLALQRESHVAFSVPSLSVSARITDVLSYMESKGLLEFVVISETDPIAEAGVGWADALILSKHNSIQALKLTQLARRLGVRVIYDIDDWIFSFPKYSGGVSQNKKQEIILEIIGLSDVITVANKSLQLKTREMIPHSILMPNGMWVEKYFPNQSAEGLESVRPRIVFTNADLLKMNAAKGMFLTALQVFFQRHPEFILDFYGDPFPEMLSLPFLHFTNRTPYAQYMRSLVSGRYQFAITPLGTDEDCEAAEFNSCKNPFKYLNYGAAKVPGLYSRSPIYNCIENGKTGLLIENHFDAWIDGLEHMAADVDLRNSIRKSAFDDVMQHHHVRDSAKALMAVLEGIA